MFSLLDPAVISLLVGCSSMPVSLGPVGPNPVGARSEAAEGELEVFSQVVAQQDDRNQAGDGEPMWHVHTDYSICNLNGKLVKQVENTI
jgi:hypothetical protein